MKIATIARNPKNSPNMTANDAAILSSVAKELTLMGAEVVAIDENGDIPEDADVVCHMSRTPEVLEKLKKAEERGITVINSPDAIEKCSRIRTMELLELNGIPQPAFSVVEKDEDLNDSTFPAWIKRGTGWSCHKNDVCYVTDKKEASKAIEEMRQRGIESFVYTAHCKGDIIKFYGVGNRYFTYSYPVADKTKFGLEKINGAIKHYPFDINSMQRMVVKAAEAIGLTIYGGDCIVDEKGNIFLIDLNDFPSFSSVREEAAKEIAQSIINTKKIK